MKTGYFTKVLPDRTIESNKEGIYCIEVIALDCPKCGQKTSVITTGKDRTYYGHPGYNGMLITWCVVERGKDFIPDALLYTQKVKGLHSEVQISITEKVW